MRTKAVPEPPATLDGLAAAQSAVPLVPEPEESCCVRLASRLDGVNKDRARTWLAFLEALGLVEAGELGYVRTNEPVDGDGLREPFVEGVFGVSEVLAVLEADGPADADSVFEAVREHVPAWERHRSPTTWESRWRERVGHLLEWGRLFGLVVVTRTGYALAEAD